MEKKLRVGILGATGMVGQRFISLLDGHPWFDVRLLAASPQSAGKRYSEAVGGRWSLATKIPKAIEGMVVQNASDVERIAAEVDFVFCAVDMKKDETLRLEEAYARAEVPVVSNNSAARMVADVPMVVPEINPEHLDVIAAQRKRLGTKRGFIAVKPNCSLQSYLPALHPLREFDPRRVIACTYQAISGAGKTFETWPEMVDNVIPFISGEEEKSENEPLKIWGGIQNGSIIPSTETVFAAQCIRVPVSDGHMAAVFVDFAKRPSRDEILARWREFSGLPQSLNLPSAPKPFLNYFEEENRPQTRLDRDAERGMGISVGRLREDKIFQYKFVSLSHNTLRGAAGGAVLIAELLKAQGYL
jgi:aspartate-semialdehyde dehydrogenase